MRVTLSTMTLRQRNLRPILVAVTVVWDEQWAMHATIDGKPNLTQSQIEKQAALERKKALGHFDRDTLHDKQKQSEK